MFSEYSGKKIALYGLGTETQKALADLEGIHEIVGLLDGFRTDGVFYGKRVISFEDAVSAGVVLIVVVARPGSCRAIAKKIGNRCRENGIVLMDIRGMDLLETKKTSYGFSGMKGVTKAELEEKIRDAEVVSFDLFDTLIMRQTLYSDDVAMYVDCRLQENGIYIDDFCRKRLTAEKELSRNSAPTLVEIYQTILDRSEINAALDFTAKQLADLEWNVDFGLLVPREDVCTIFRKTAAAGKKLYVVSDTYYGKNQLVQLLEKCGITDYTDILSSSDYGTGKLQGLFGILKDREQSEKYLHIGDDVAADVEGAGKWGVETCRIYSGLDLLELLGGMGFQNYEEKLSDHLKMGMFVARIFNSPFQFENGEAKLAISKAYDVGYLLCAPVISDFVLWFYGRIQDGQFHNIWFSARDGYLIKEMYGHLTKMRHKEDESVYFLTSRTAAVRAGVQCEKDIRYVDEMKFSGTLEENLKERFGIEMDDAECSSVLKDEDGLMKYKDAILDNTLREFHNYQKYIEKVDIKDGDIAFFDFVAKGTTQMFVQRLTDHRLKGFYFLQLEKEHMKGKELDICAFYEDGEADSCAIYNNYYILETLLTAPHPSVQGFDEAGNPVRAIETRSGKDIQCFGMAQQGILNYFKTYVELCPEKEGIVNRKLDEVFLDLVHKFNITDDDFLGLTLEDSFFNRMTDMMDVL